MQVARQNHKHTEYEDYDMVLVNTANRKELKNKNLHKSCSVNLFGEKGLQSRNMNTASKQQWKQYTFIHTGTQCFSANTGKEILTQLWRIKHIL